MIARVASWPWRVIRVRPRLFAGLACGLVARGLMPAGLGPTTAAVVAWDIGVFVYLLLSAMLLMSEHLDVMPQHAEAQQEGEWTIFWLTVAAAIFSFAAIVGEFANAGNLPRASKGLHVALVAVTLLLSWLMTHTTFALRYAHEYYARDLGGPDFDRGLEFPQEQRPDYGDFLYFSLVLGMTFQVSDVQITSRKLRRVAAVHGLLSFLFNTIILALTVNIAAGLV